jgi:hypothetical protein
MNSANTSSPVLKWDVLTSKRPGLSRDLPAGKEALQWVANSSTLIFGEHDAVLVDTFLTTEQSRTFVNSAIPRCWLNRSARLSPRLTSAPCQGSSDQPQERA